MRWVAVDLRMRWVRAAMVCRDARSGRRLRVARHGHCLEMKGASRDGYVNALYSNEEREAARRGKVDKLYICQS